MLVMILAVLSASAAAGMRIALPLLILGLVKNNLFWENAPLISQIPPQPVLAILISWSLFELFGSKQLLGQRILQLVQLAFSPLVGALMAISVINRTAIVVEQPVWLIGLIGALFALVLKLVEIGWFFRWRGIPLWLVLAEDFLCISLVLLALKAPEQGGLIAMFLLWLAIRSSTQWQRWHKQTTHLSTSENSNN